MKYRQTYRLPEVLRKLIDDKGFTIFKFSERVGIQERMIHTYLRNEGTPSLYTLMTLAEYFNVTLDFLVYGDQEDVMYRR